MKLNKLVLSAALSFVVGPAFSAEGAQGFSDITYELPSQTRAWISSPSLRYVESNVHDKALTELGMSESDLPDIFVNRVFTSSFYNVYIDGNRYITDESATYWMQNKNSEFFIFNEGAYGVSATNATKESLIELSPLIEAMVDDYLVEYLPINTKVKRTVYAFMDLSCPHCKEFHLNKRQEWQAKGVRIVYVPFLRDTGSRRVAEATAGAFCQETAEQRKDSINKVFMDGVRRVDFSSAECSSLQKGILDFMFNSGAVYRLRGSPMFLTDTGRVYYGYSPFEIGESKTLETP